jgi:hypothetical protein
MRFSWLLSLYHRLASVPVAAAYLSLVRSCAECVFHYSVADATALRRCATLVGQRSESYLGVHHIVPLFRFRCAVQPFVTSDRPHWTYSGGLLCDRSTLTCAQLHIEEIRVIAARRSNQTLELTPSRTAFTLSMISLSSFQFSLAAGRRS